MIKAHFDAPHLTEARAYNVYQYDWGQRLQITGLESLNLPNVVEVQYEIDGEGTAITRIGTVEHGVIVADVPFKCLQYAKKITAYIYIVDADSARTIKAVSFTPQRRAKPDDDVTPEEERTVDAMVKSLNAASEKANLDINTAADAAESAENSATAAASSAAAAAASARAAASNAETVKQKTETVIADAAAVTEMYNNLTIIIDGGDAVKVDTHIIDGGTATSKEGTA